MFATAILAMLAVGSVSIGAFLQEMTFYTELDQQGGYVTVRTHLLNATGTDYEHVLGYTKSYCQSGMWQVNPEPDYQGNGGGVYLFSPHWCGNFREAQSYKSVRYFAAAETTQPAIDLFAGIALTYEDHLVMDPAATSLPFAARSYVTSGRSSWTFFSEPNFEGKSTCVLAGTADMDYNLVYYPEIIGSLALGCGEEAANNIRKFQAGI